MEEDTVADVVETEVLAGRDVVVACAQADLRNVGRLWRRQRYAVDWPLIAVD